MVGDGDMQLDLYRATISAPKDPLVPVEPTQPTPDPVATDTVAPQSRFTRRPPNRTRQRLGVFRLGSSEAGSRFECKLDRGRCRACPAPKRVKVKPGRRTIHVRAIDAAGNRDATPAVDRWTVLKKKRKTGAARTLNHPKGVRPPPFAPGRKTLRRQSAFTWTSRG